MDGAPFPPSQWDCLVAGRFAEGRRVQKIAQADGHKLFHSRRTLFELATPPRILLNSERKTQGSIYRANADAVVLHNKGELFESEIASEVCI